MILVLSGMCEVCGRMRMNCDLVLSGMCEVCGRMRMNCDLSIERNV